MHAFIPPEGEGKVADIVLVHMAAVEVCLGLLGTRMQPRLHNCIHTTGQSIFGSTSMDEIQQQEVGQVTVLTNVGTICLLKIVMVTSLCMFCTEVQVSIEVINNRGFAAD